MELGEKLKQARLEAGLSQRQLCEGIVTRNMLSQIEHGSAHPSMNTLQAFAERLHKTVSYFLEEQAVVSPNLACMTQAKQAFRDQNWKQALEILRQFQSPDPVFEDEQKLLTILCTLEFAQSVLEDGKTIYARELLQKIEKTVKSCPYASELERRRLLMLGKTVPAKQAAPGLPSLDEELMLRCRWALEQGDTEKAGAYLACTEKQSGEEWAFLQGTLFCRKKQYRQAAEYLMQAPRTRQVFAMLEVCYREQGDYQKAYEYACRQR